MKGFARGIVLVFNSESPTVVSFAAFVRVVTQRFSQWRSVAWRPWLTTAAAKETTPTGIKEQT